MFNPLSNGVAVPVDESWTGVDGPVLARFAGGCADVETVGRNGRLALAEACTPLHSRVLRCCVTALDDGALNLQPDRPHR
jgi:hypothetical protein